MKTMLALALVGLLSITSLAEEKKFEEQEGSSIKPLTKDEPDELSQKSCPSGFKRIEDKDTGNFCISDLENYRSFDDANSHCQSLKGLNRTQGELCSNLQLVSACSKKENFVRSPAKVLMHTLDLGSKFFLIMGGAGCDKEQISSRGRGPLPRYRCCIQF